MSNDLDKRKDDFQWALYSGYIDGNAAAKQSYKPRLLVNDAKKGTKVLSTILSELSSCDEFMFSVAFITTSGVAVLINTLIELEKKGIKGTILTSQYQNFTDPEALRRLLRFKNIELRIQVDNNFHAKGYLFRKADEYTIIIGSSNLTANALCSNSEWNLMVSALDAGSIRGDISNTFKEQFDSATVVDDAYLDMYEKIYQKARIARDETLENVIDFASAIVPKPNSMQKSALKSLEAIREEGKNRALIISATGTGKTYLAAFDSKVVNPKRLLFVVHRENIARAAMRTFKMVFGVEKTMGFYTGSEHNEECDFLFSTVQTLSKKEHYERFNPESFDYIVVDEVHHLGANSYQALLEYFHPKFLLGMTATPERTDDYDIFKAFNYDIAYELRLHDALELNMLSPFHYYGVTDVTVDGEIIEEESAFNKLTSEERVNNILKKAKLYGCDRGRIKGLIFCSRVEEAEELEKKLTEKGLKVKALSGDSSESDRENAIELLESDAAEHYDYLITRDIFNEGIDIPSVNQVIMLRPTQSAIVYVQQLGRGLRKTFGKDYLTVIDFIGNYKNNFMIPIALYGDQSFNKDTVRKYIAAGSALIPGPSTISFDAISKERIYKSIDQANFGQLKELKHDFEYLERVLGRTPMMCDFVKHNGRDPFSFVKYSGSYYAFLSKIKKNDNNDKLSDSQIGHLAFFSNEICNAKRFEELTILKTLFNNESVELNKIREDIENNQLVYSEEAIVSAINLLNRNFLTAAAIEKYGALRIVDSIENKLVRTKEFEVLLENKTFSKFLRDDLEYAINRYKENRKDASCVRGFIRGEKYSRKDVCRILNWPKNEESIMFGYQIKYGTCPIFVTYEKGAGVKGGSTDYEDYFINQQTFHWMTRHNKTLESSEVKSIKTYKENNLRICLFIKKSDGEGDDFYYIGELTPYEFNQTTIRNAKDNSVEPIVNINYVIDQPVGDNLYNYITGNY